MRHPNGWRRRLAFAAGLSVAILCGTAPEVRAQDPIHKMGRGMANTLTGWLELPKHLNLGWQAGNPITGLFKGLMQGTGLAVLRTGLGLYEAVTFPIPLPKGFASPYEGMALNEYAWE